MRSHVPRRTKETPRYPPGLFNASLEGNTGRAIPFHEDDRIDDEALKALVVVAVALNTSLRARALEVRRPRPGRRG
jgi:hypothetical protein